MALLLADGVRFYEADSDTFLHFMRGDSILSGCTIVAQGTPNMTVNYAGGTIRYAGAVVTSAANAALAIAAADVTNPRIDLVHVSGTTGVVAVVTGTPLGTPKPPALPAGSLLIGYVSVGVSAANIGNSNITSRVFLGQDAPVAGTLAARPTAAVAGKSFYFGTDTVTLYHSNGTTWTAVTGGAMTNPMTTAGDLIIGGASGAPTRLAYVADTTMLSGSAGAPAWTVRPWYALAKQVTTNTLGNSTTEGDMFRSTIGAGAMGAVGVLRLKLYGTYTNTSGGASTLQLRIKFGATIVLDTTAFSMAVGVGARRWELEVLIWNAGATNSQRVTGRWLVASSAAGNFVPLAVTPVNAFGDGTSTEDTTAAKDLAVTAQHGTAAATIEITSKEGILELML